MARGSIYVHFPYCLAKCPYCDFVSYAKPAADIDHEGYADALLAEARARSADGRDLDVESVFFGGGTPSLWSTAALGRVLATLRELFTVRADAEITVECNPTSLGPDKAHALQAVGVNRLSIGTQSLDAAELAFLGREHSPQNALGALRAALEVPGLRISTDLIFGLPGQSQQAVLDQSAALADIGLRHLSCYQLTIEPGTRFGELAKVGRLPLADDGRVAEAFLALDSALTARGFEHYEISNYAQPGQHSVHNMGYWRGQPYLGLGTGAFGFLSAEQGAYRYRNPVDPARYCSAALQLPQPPPASADARHAACQSFASYEAIDAETQLREQIMLGLRLRSGIDLAAAARALGVRGWSPERERSARELLARGRIERDGDVVRMTPSGWLFADDTAARLF